MFAIFLFVKAVNSVRSKQASTTHACPYCQQQISKLATKCPYCCSNVTPEKIEDAQESDLQKGVKKLTKRMTKVAKIAKKVVKIK